VIGEIDHRRLTDYKLGQAVLMWRVMVAYARACARWGFFGINPPSFLGRRSFILGRERRWHVMIPVSLLTAGTIWYLVQEILRIFSAPICHSFLGELIALPSKELLIGLANGPFCPKNLAMVLRLSDRHVHWDAAGSRA